MSRIKYPESTDIVCLEADVNYTIFHLMNGKKVVSSFTLKKHEQKQELGAFLRVSRSYLLNPNYIQRIDKVGKKTIVQMADGYMIHVSRRKQHVLNF